MENKLIKISKYKNNMVESPFGENMKRQAFHSTKTLKEPTTTFEEISEGVSSEMGPFHVT
jgi:hypothetical protein